MDFFIIKYVHLQITNMNRSGGWLWMPGLCLLQKGEGCNFVEMSGEFAMMVDGL